MFLQAHFCYAKKITDDIQKNIDNQISSSVTHIKRQMRGENCFATADVKCKLQSDDSDCEDMIVKSGECGIVPVQFKFKFCNTNEKLTIFLKEKKTFGNIFKRQISMNTKPLVPGKCRTNKVNSKVNTCKMSRINAQLKVEGKIPIKNGDDYCYAFDYYSKKIRKFEAISKPPNVKLFLECYVESVNGSGIYDKECGDMDVTDFQAAPARRHLQESSGSTEFDNFLKDFLFIYKVKNDSGEQVQVSDVTVLFNALEFELVGIDDNVVVAPNSDFTSEGDIVSVDLSQFGGDSITIGGQATAVGEASALTVTVDIEQSLPIGIP